MFFALQKFAVPELDRNPWCLFCFFLIPALTNSKLFLSNSSRTRTQENEAASVGGAPNKNSKA